jgi:hypothetical protein
MRYAGVLAVLALIAAPALAAITTPYVAGDFQGWDAGANPMTETFPGSGIFTASFSGLGAGTRHEFKITDGTWDNSFPGPNSWLYADAAGEITIGYDINTYADGWSPTTERLSESADPGAWTAVGDWQHLVGGTDWTNNDPLTAMVPQGGGIYSLQATLPPGDYNWKAVVTGAWDSISWDNRSVNTANWGFTVDAANPTVIFSVNAFAGTVMYELVPEPAALLGLGLLALLLRRR